MHVPLSISKYFTTCNGKYYGGGMLDSPFLRNKLWSDEFVFMQNTEQISIFDSDIMPLDYDVST